MESTIQLIKAVANQWMFDSGIVIASVHNRVLITHFNSRVNEFSLAQSIHEACLNFSFVCECSQPCFSNSKLVGEKLCSVLLLCCHAMTSVNE